MSESFPLSHCVAEVEIDRVEYTTSEDGKKEYLDIFYKRGDRGSLKDRRFAVTKESVAMFKRDGENPAQTEDRLKKELDKVLTHIASKVCNDDELGSIQADSFKEFCLAYAELINTHCAGVKLYMKTTMKNGFVAAPKAGKFLQRMDDGMCALSYTENEKKALEREANGKEGVSFTDKPDEAV